MNHYDVIIVGGGQAGLSISHYCQKMNLTHIVLEKNTVMNAWREKRWDSFTLVTPNWQCQLPDHPYDGKDPHGFMNQREILEYLDHFSKKVSAPVIEHCAVTKVEHNGRYFVVSSEQGGFSSEQLVVASGSYQTPIIPPYALRIPAHIQQIHSEQYKNSEQLNSGEVLVVGSGQSGAQIAEDLHLKGRKVHLAVGDAPRVARFYRGKDVVDWLDAMKYYRMPVDEHPLREGVRDNTNHYVTGRDGGRDIDLRKFALEGMSLYGKMVDFDNGQFQFKPTLKQSLDSADATYNGINQRIDDYIEKAGIQAPEPSRYQPIWQPTEEPTDLNLEEVNLSAIVWCIGFRPDYQWLQVPVFDGKGYPQHTRGVTNFPGLYFIGLPWLYTWGSGRFSGIDQDAHHVVNTATEFKHFAKNKQRA